jgi:hypothetical protein
MWRRLYTYYRAKYCTQNVVIFICLEGHGGEISVLSFFPSMGFTVLYT